MPGWLRDAGPGSFAATLLLAFAPSPVRAQAALTVHRDMISGRVTSDSTHGLAHVDVIISRAPDRAFLRAVTDSNGHYAIVFEQGTGDYLVHVSAPGMTTVRKRVTRTGSDSVFTVDVVLESGAAEQLATVHVSAQKPKPYRNCDYNCGSIADVMDDADYGVRGAVTPDLAGNIAAIAATVPSLLVTRDGLSAGGVSAQQNSTTLNGMSFPGAELPRDAMTSVQVRTSPYDPAEGWFGGAEQAVRISSQAVVAFGHAHLTLDAPFLQYTDLYSAESGQRFTNEQAGFGSTGFALGDRLGYNYGVSGSRRMADGTSLSSAPPDVLDRSSIAPDSAARLLSALGAIGVPIGGPAQRITERGSFVGSIGSREANIVTPKSPRTMWDVLGYANISRTNSVLASATATGESSAAASNDVGEVQGHFSTYVHDLYLLEAQSAISVSHSSTTPLINSPAGIVSVLSDLGGGMPGFSAARFGGYSAGGDLTQGTWETSANMRLYVPGSATHELKIAADSRLDRWREQTGTNALGTFAFNSIDDVRLNHPVSFTRTVQPAAQAASAWNGFASIGDWWRKSATFQMMYGARLEANRFFSAPAANPAVASIFGERTDFTPNTIHVSPRIGFAYTMRGSNGGYTQNAIGRFGSAPAGYLRGGIGEFRSFMSPALVGALSSRTGLAAATQNITCVGEATPIPQWSQYLADASSIPTDCVGGSAARTFTDAAPSVELLDRSYSAPRSWRANLVYGTVLDGAIVTLEGAYSLNVDQPGRVDLNFANETKFVTSDEQRPVYVGADAVVPRSGALVTTMSRRDDSFGQVLDDVTNLESTNKRLTISVSPDPATLKGWFASAAYTISDTRALSSGFDNSTFASPTARQWSRGDFDARHRVVLQGGVTAHGVTFTLFGRIQSGFPFTPLVGSDVNGDGFANDRAFIFDPARVADASVAAGMRSLLGSSQNSVRDCLIKQFERAAAANSCEGPWTAALNAQLDFQFRFPRSRRKTDFVVAFTNPLGGLDQILHGADHLRGWGTNPFPDPVLYNVRGFDPAADRYQYAVNPRFGDTRPTAGVPRAPFGVTLDFSIDIAPPIDRQVVNMLLKPGRNGFPGTRLNAAALKRRYEVTNPDPFQEIIEESDSLMLSRGQTEALEKADESYSAQRDTILTALATDLANLGDSFSARAATRRQNEALAALWDVGHVAIRRELPLILNRFQLRMLPYWASQLYSEPDDVTGAAIIARYR